MSVSQSFDPSRGDTSAAPPGPVFVSRSAPAKRDDAPLLASDGSALPTLRDPRVRWLIALTIALQIWAWWRVDGFQLADSVEFMERARSFVRGEPLIDAGVIRPFGFSFLFVPFFALAEWFGLTDQRAVVWCVTLFQMVLGCVLVWRCMRLGARLAGSSGAFAAGLFVACNPVLLQYSTQPVSDIAAGVCIAFALENVLERGSFARAMRAGLWLALAFVIAYKSLLVSLALFVMLVLRDRWKHSHTWRGVTIGVSFGLLVQSTLDWIMYGAFGASVANYLVVNGGAVPSSFFTKVYFRTEWEWSKNIAAWFYGKQAELRGMDWPGVTDTTPRGLQGPWFYLLELPTMVVWPAIVLMGAGLVRAVVRASWKPWLLIGVLFTCFMVMSNKGSKDFRLWLPLLPFLAPIVASGWTWIAGAFGGLRGLVATLATVAVLVFGVRQLASINVRQYGGYWAAIDWVDARARATLEERREAARVTGRLGEPAPLRVGSAYNWAVFLRSSPLIEVVKLPWQLNLWKTYEDPKVVDGRRKKNDDLTTIAELDVLLVHHPILTQNLDLMQWINAHFEVAGAFYDQRTYAGLGPIYVLERRTGAPGARTFFDIVSANEAALSGSTLPGSHAIDFIGPGAGGNGGDRLELLSVEFQTLPPQEFGWITYRWRANGPLSRDFRFNDRITSPDERNVWQNNHPPAYGNAPTSQWTAGEILSESYLVVAADKPFLPEGQVRPIGGGYRRGDLIPTRTWMRVEAYDPASLETPGATPVPVAELLPARAGETQAIRASGASGAHETPDGIQFGADDYVRVAGFFVPVRTPWRLADDGRPIPP